VIEEGDLRISMRNGGFPAMMAALIASLDTPAIQSGSMPPSASAS
jgi:hypothetical protein